MRVFLALHDEVGSLEWAIVIQQLAILKGGSKKVKTILAKPR